jgi:hypothetical protein
MLVSLPFSYELVTHLVFKILFLQERLGDEDVRSGRNDQQLGSETQQTRQTEAVQGGH